MRYSAEHKEQSRGRILEAARKLFRREGFDGASIDQVMGAAELTRGAFYAHFESKEDLVRQVLEIDAGLVLALQGAAVTDEPRDAAMVVLSDYLSPDQRVDNATGCPLIAHPVDAIRGDVGRREGYTNQLTSLIDGIQNAAGEGLSSDGALLVAILAIGAGLLSAASADAELADRIEKVGLDEIENVIDCRSTRVPT